MVGRPDLRPVYVPPWRYSQLDANRQPAAQARGRVAGRSLESDPATVERRPGLIDELADGALQYAAGGEAQLLVLRDEPPAHRSIGAEDEHGWIGQAVHRNLAGGVHVDLGAFAIPAVGNAVGPDHIRFVIGQQGEGNPFSRGEIVQHGAAVVADRRQAQACSL